MKKLIKDIIFAWKFKRAVRKADYLRHITHRKYMVIVIKGRLEVISKQDIKKFVAGGVWKSHTNLTHPGKYFRPSKVKIMRPTSPK